MSLANEDKFNKLFKSTTMVAQREAERNPPQVSERAKIQARHAKDMQELQASQAERFEAIKDRHNAENRDDPRIATNGRVPAQLVLEREQELDRMREKNRAGQTRMRQRHAQEVEDHLARVGIAK